MGDDIGSNLGLYTIEFERQVFKSSIRLMANQGLGTIINWLGSLRADGMEIMDSMDTMWPATQKTVIHLIRWSNLIESDKKLSFLVYV
jgi:hypothetical protein